MSSTTAANPVAAPSESGDLSHKQIMTILSGLLLGMFLAALDQTVVSTAIRTIGDDLHGLSIQAWVTTAFLITSTISTPLFGKLSDIYGRKPFFMLAITIFILGSMLCGLAQSMYQLAAFRAFQGIGAGGIMPLALAIIGDIIPPRERARYQGYFMAVFATSSVLGPVVGGFLAGQSSIFGITGWRWIFYINVPIGIFALFVVTRVLHLDHNRRDHRIDWAGASALVVALVPLLIIAEQGRTWGWGSASAFVCYFLGLLGIAAFIWIEGRMGDEALLPLRLFRHSVFALGSVQSIVVGMGMFGGIACVPLYLQIVQGASPTKAGLLMLPLIGGLMVGSLTTGQITSRTGRYKIFPVIGSVMMVVGLLLMTRIGADSALWVTDIYMAIFGLGLGMNMQTIVLAMQNAVDPKDMGVATSAVTFFRQVGGSLGTAIFLSILFSSAGNNIATEYAKARTQPSFQAAAAAHPDQLKAITGGASLNDTSFLHTLDRAIAHPFLVGFSNAMDLVFLVGSLLLVLAIVLSASMKEVPLRMMSGQQAARAAAANAEQRAVPVDVSPPHAEAEDPSVRRAPAPDHP
ncbi:MAG TPA: MDR family MFS transporter [Jatrophihabitans sp.]|jgi:EmrB/QacA subfamily drug resistance transporter|uniref:MDR family MFS transporter n=1 Tax=Jatrophihabitans sp. TaxID=1932789 RepID=UPI002E0BB91D|nr:MDR family MFS transporter [Jatrophihabitans sp.]